jgi:hypothetical protein
MDEDRIPEGEEGAGSTPPEGGAADEPGPTTSGAQATEWLGQLQRMIDDLATQASPTVRQVGAKAAELAAAAAERAGPLAQRAAEVTGDVGQRLAERSRSLAEELRREPAGASEPESARADEPRIAAGVDVPAEPEQAAPESAVDASDPAQGDDGPGSPILGA